MFSDYLTLDNITVDGKEAKYEKMEVFNSDSEESANYSILEINAPLTKGASSEIIINATVSRTATNDTLKITNKASLYNDTFIMETDEDIYYYKEEKITTPEDKKEEQEENNGETESEEGNIDNKAPGGNISGGSSNKPSGQNNNNNSRKFDISGTVWLDGNENGSKDSNEQKMNDITVYAIDIKTNKIATDIDGNTITAKTDKDGFYTLKNVNDTLGHKAGDDLIKTVPICVKKVLGKDTEICRIGGDEFALVLSLDRDTVYAKIKELKEAASNYKTKLIDSVSFSVGYASNETHKVTNMNELFINADALMYEDKEKYYKDKKKSKRAN